MKFTDMIWPWGGVDRLARELDEERERSASYRVELADLNERLWDVAEAASKRSAEIARLRLELEEARRNDNRSPKTGRYVKGGKDGV